MDSWLPEQRRHAQLGQIVSKAPATLPRQLTASRE